MWPQWGWMSHERLGVKEEAGEGDSMKGEQGDAVSWGLVLIEEKNGRKLLVVSCWIGLIRGRWGVWREGWLQAWGETQCRRGGNDERGGEDVRVLRGGGKVGGVQRWSGGKGQGFCSMKGEGDSNG